MKRDQKGFSPVEIILALLVAALLAFIAWYVWHQKQSKTSTPVASQPKQVEKAKDPYEGWKEYCSKQEKACFKYPADWTTVSSEPQNPDGTGDAVTLKGPNSMELVWQSDVSGIGGACDPASDPHVYFYKVNALKAVPNLYVVESGDKTKANEIGLINGPGGKAPALGDTGECLYYALFDKKGTIDGHAGLSGRWDSDTQKQDLANAELILQSFYYQ